DPRTTARADVPVGRAADFTHRFGKADVPKSLVELAVERPGLTGRQMIPGYAKLRLFRGLRVTFLEHPPIYSKGLIGEGFFNRLLGVSSNGDNTPISGGGLMP